MKTFKKIWPYIVSVILLIIAAVASLYATAIVIKSPLNVPFVEAYTYNDQISANAQSIINDWRNRSVYVPEKTYDSVEEIIADDDIEVEAVSETDFFANMNLVEQTSLKVYIDSNPDVLENGYEKLFIDKVDILNTPTGIKATTGDDVLAIDSMDGITIMGRDIVSDTGTSKVKIAVINNKAQLDVNLVKELGYWDRVEEHAAETGAILAVNASTYNWNETGNYGMLYGALKYHGTLQRKAVENQYVHGFLEDGTLMLGADVETLYNAWETSPILIKDGVTVYTAPENEARYALSAIGQTADGKTIIMSASGGAYGSNLGVTPSELLKIMTDYGATNATCLSGGTRTMMYWNGRNVVEAVGYQENGVRLPNAIVVKPAALVPGIIETENKVETETSETTGTDTSETTGSDTNNTTSTGDDSTDGAN